MTTAPRRFVILAARRSGSNLLCSLLGSHPEVRCHHELFNPNGIFTLLDERDEATPADALAARDRDPLGFLDHVWRDTRGARAIGFKMTPEQAPEVLAHVLADAGIAKIVLRRQNALRRLVSERIADLTGRWEAYDDAVPLARPRIHVEAGELAEHAARVDAFHADIDAALLHSGQSPLSLRYECLFDPDEQARLLAFLGLPPHPLRTRSIRQNPEPLDQLVENAPALRRALAGTPLAHVFD
jgi:LPS sulfotransferase NodH